MSQHSNLLNSDDLWKVCCRTYHLDFGIPIEHTPNHQLLHKNWLDCVKRWELSKNSSISLLYKLSFLSFLIDYCSNENDELHLEELVKGKMLIIDTSVKYSMKADDAYAFEINTEFINSKISSLLYRFSFYKQREAFDKLLDDSFEESVRKDDLNRVDWRFIRFDKDTFYDMHQPNKTIFSHQIQVVTESGKEGIFFKPFGERKSESIFFPADVIRDFWKY